MVFPFTLVNPFLSCMLFPLHLIYLMSLILSLSTLYTLSTVLLVLACFLICLSSSIAYPLFARCVTIQIGLLHSVSRDSQKYP